MIRRASRSVCSRSGASQKTQGKGGPQKQRMCSPVKKGVEKQRTIYRVEEVTEKGNVQGKRTWRIGGGRLRNQKWKGNKKYSILKRTIPNKKEKRTAKRRGSGTRRSHEKVR